MRNIIKQGQKFEREELPKEQALARFAGDEGAVQARVRARAVREEGICRR